MNKGLIGFEESPIGLEANLSQGEEIAKVDQCRYRIVDADTDHQSVHRDDTERIEQIDSQQAHTYY